MEQDSKSKLYEQFKWLRPPENEKENNNTESAVDRVVTMINENKSPTEIESKLTKEQKEELQTITGEKNVTTAITTINNFYKAEKNKEG
jgi:peptide methionine sulfoxide reductase MsrA